VYAGINRTIPIRTKDMVLYATIALEMRGCIPTQLDYFNLALIIYKTLQTTYE